jgi:hypothetical protein
MVSRLHLPASLGVNPIDLAVSAVYTVAIDFQFTDGHSFLEEPLWLKE